MTDSKDPRPLSKTTAKPEAAAAPKPEAAKPVAEPKAAPEKPAATKAAPEKPAAEPKEAQGTLDLGFSLEGLNIQQLAQLQADAAVRFAEAKKAALVDARRAVEKLASDWGFSMLELGFQPVKSKSKAPIGAPKYRNPADPAQTWTGTGRKPQWILDALEKGVDIETMKI
jgi:DNA-binding protein H-NS